MELRKPDFYDSFHCIAACCPDSCCKEWDVAVDAEKAALYRALPGALGEKLREFLQDEDGDTYLTLDNGRCPMWRADGLCRIQAELGEGALCKTCREFPRLTHDYGSFVELGLELSCPEAARLLLKQETWQWVQQGQAEEADPDMALLLRTRLCFCWTRSRQIWTLKRKPVCWKHCAAPLQAVRCSQSPTAFTKTWAAER